MSAESVLEEAEGRRRRQEAGGRGAVVKLPKTIMRTVQTVTRTVKFEGTVLVPHYLVAFKSRVFELAEEITRILI